MIQLISREEVFSGSRLADHYISDAQRPYFEEKTGDEGITYGYEVLEESMSDYTDDEESLYSYDEEGSLLKDLDDHTEPVQGGERLTDDFAVLGYSKKNIVNYVVDRSKALIRFFEIMHVTQLYLMDEKRYDWLRFPFRSREKLAALQKLVNMPSYREAFKMDTAELEFILPLFHYSSRHSMPVILLISADDKVPIAMYLCDDGSFHTSFHSQDREKIFYAASAAGLVMGGVEVCRNM